MYLWLYYITKEGVQEHNPNWPEIPDHPYKMLIVRNSGFGKTNGSFNLINHGPDVDTTFYMLKIQMM